MINPVPCNLCSVVGYPLHLEYTAWLLGKTPIQVFVVWTLIQVSCVILLYLMSQLWELWDLVNKFTVQSSDLVERIGEINSQIKPVSFRLDGNLKQLSSYGSVATRFLK